MPIIDLYDEFILGLGFLDLFVVVGLISIILAIVLVVKFIQDISWRISQKRSFDVKTKRIALIIDLLIPAICFALGGEILAVLVFVILLALALSVTEMILKRLVAKQKRIQQIENELAQKFENSSCLKSVLNAIITSKESEWIRKEQESSDSCRRCLEVFCGGVVIKWSGSEKIKITKYIFNENGYSDLVPYAYGSGKKECLSISNVCSVFARLISEHMTEQIPGIKFDTVSISFSSEYPRAPHFDNYAYIYYSLPKRKLENIL